MKPQDRIVELEAQVAALTKEKETLSARVIELEARPAAGSKSKSLQMAEAALDLLKKGPVNKTQLLAIHPKYPTDAIYHVRTLLKVDVRTVKANGRTVYMLPEHWQTYQDGLKKEAEAKAAQAVVPPTQQQQPVQAAA